MKECAGRGDRTRGRLHAKRTRFRSSYRARWQVLMDEPDKEKTAFACHRDLFQFNVMPFGLNTAPAIFSRTDVQNA